MVSTDKQLVCAVKTCIIATVELKKVLSSGDLVPVKHFTFMDIIRKISRITILFYLIYRLWLTTRFGLFKMPVLTNLGNNSETQEVKNNIPPKRTHRRSFSDMENPSFTYEMPSITKPKIKILKSAVLDILGKEEMIDNKLPADPRLRYKPPPLSVIPKSCVLNLHRNTNRFKQFNILKDSYCKLPDSEIFHHQFKNREPQLEDICIDPKNASTPKKVAKNAHIKSDNNQSGSVNTTLNSITSICSIDTKKILNGVSTTLKDDFNEIDREKRYSKRKQFVQQFKKLNKKTTCSENPMSSTDSTDSITIFKDTDEMVNFESVSVTTEAVENFKHENKLGISTKIVDYFLTYKQEIDAAKPKEFHENFDFMSGRHPTIHSNPQIHSIWKN